MRTLCLYVMNNKEVELAERLLDSSLVESVEIHDKDASICGYTGEMLCVIPDHADLLWIGMILGETGYKSICHSKII